MTPVDVVEAYVREREALLRSARPGDESARELSDLTDTAVSEAAEAAFSRLRVPWAVLALGGWGARRLLPASDLDLLVVTDAAPDDLKPAVSAMLYPLWDAGLTVGHQVRSRRDHLRRVRDDVQTLTATLTGRTLAGDRSLGERLLTEVARDARKRSRRVLRQIAARERPGSPYLLEPDLKNGAGGQRDLDELAWTAAVLMGEPAADHEPLAALDMLGSNESERLFAARDRITAARWEVHRLTLRPTAALALDVADDVDVPLAELHGALADVHHLLLRARGRLAGSPVPGDSLANPDAAVALRADELFALLGGGPDALPRLEDAAWSHRLDDLVPGMSDLMTLRRPALTHAYTVGAHSLRTAVAAGSESSTGKTGPTAEGEHRILLTAALLHDIGKMQSGPGHAERGARTVSTIAPRLGLDTRAAADVALLVREHLLLPETAATEDIHDEDTVLRTAGRVGDPLLVRPLFELTAADSRSTGPGAWTEWQAALAGELAERVQAALAEDGAGARTAARAERVRRDAIALADDDARPEVTRFATEAPLRYLGAQRPADVVSHARLVASAAHGGPASVPAVAVTPGRAARTWRVSVAAADHPGLFAAIAGSLALSGLDILAADAYAAAPGVALDVFAVRPDTLATVDESTFAAFERRLAPALSDPAGLAARIETRRSHYSPGRHPSPGRHSTPTVSIEHTGAYATALYVTAADRIGLLYDIARAIAEHDLDIRWAKATTHGHTVRDVFHVVDATGQPVEDVGVLGHLSMRIRELG